MQGRASISVPISALAVIIGVTAGWWALALYPASVQPEWLARTRLACFGAAPGGLPNAGGWVLLVGEPLGMLGVLLAGWGGALRRDLAVLVGRWWGRALVAGVALSLLAGASFTAVYVRRVAAQDAESFASGLPREQWAPVRQPVPVLSLVDQRGRTFDLRSLRGRPVLVTFAFAHCATVCPTLVRRVMRARDDAGRDGVPLVVVTVDPWRDAPARLPTIARAWNLQDGDLVLSGEVDAVNRTLDAWGVARTRDPSTGDVAHASPVLLVDRDGAGAWRAEAIEALGPLLRGS